MRVNWFSPLPPQPGGIADYTAQLVPLLCRLAEVTLWTDQDNWDRRLQQVAAVRRYQAEDLAASDFDPAAVNVYHLGNNAACHRAIWQVSQKCPGLVVLHNLCVQDLFFDHYNNLSGEPGRQTFIKEMGRYYGAAGAQMAQDALHGRVPKERMRTLFPLTELALQRALGVVVHSRKGCRALKRYGTLPMRYLPLPYPCSAEPLTRLPLRDPAAPYRVVLCGHYAAGHCLDQVWQALAHFPWRHRFHLDVYGEPLPGAKVEAQRLSELHLEGQVLLHGRVSEAVLESALAEADLAINLRSPSLADASHAQLRFWSHGLSSIVSNTGWYAGLPQDALAAVRPGQEVEGLRQHLVAFLRDPAQFYRRGRRGWEYLRDYHAPQAYAHTLLEFAGAVHRPAACRAAGAGGVMQGWATAALRERLRGVVGAALCGWADAATGQSLQARVTAIMERLATRPSGKGQGDEEITLAFPQQGHEPLARGPLAAA